MRGELAVADLEMRDDVDLRIAEQLGDHRSDQPVVGADALLAEEDEVVRNGLDGGGEHLGDAERVGVAGLAFDVHGLRRAAGERLAQRLLRAVGAERDHGDVAARFFLQADRLFERELVVRRDDELQSRLVDLAAVGDLDARLGIGNVA